MGMMKEQKIELLKNKLGFWPHLTEAEQDMVEQYSTIVSFRKNTPVHNTDEECLGLLLLKSGQMRIYMLSEDGREVTLYRLFQGDTCVLSASCVLDAIAFDVMIHAEEDTEALLIPLSVFRKLQEDNIYVEAFAYQMATERFSEVMWTCLLYTSYCFSFPMFWCGNFEDFKIRA